ncbi:MAG: PAS domain S-box protein [Candidatus Neomarinimicrobiota bacterium]
MSRINNIDLNDKSRPELVALVKELQGQLTELQSTNHPNEQRKNSLLKDIIVASIVNSPMGLIIWEIHGHNSTIIEWNKAAERIFGWSQTDVLGKNFLTFLLPADDIQVFQQIMDLFQVKHSPHNYQNECLTKNSGKARINWFNTPMIDKRNNRLFVLSLIEDISDRARAEEALRSTNQTYDALIQGAPLAIIILDRNLRISLWNPAAEKIFGWSRTNVLNQALPLVDRRNNFSLENTCKQVLQGKSFENIDVYCVRKNSAAVVINISLAPLRDEAEEVSGIMLLAHDITEKTQAKAALSVSEERNRTLLAAIPDLIFRVAKNGAIIDRIPSPDARLERQFKWDSQDNISQIFSPTAAADLLKCVKLALADNQVQVLEFGYGADSDERFYEARIVASGRDETLIMLRDVTERRVRQNRIVDTLEETSKADSQKSMLISNISYEVFTPLNSIRGFVELIESRFRDQLQDEDRRLFDSIYRSSDELIRVTGEIADISAVDNGELEIKPETINLQELIESICLEYRDTTKQQGLDLKVESTVETPLVSGDLFTVRQALTHLIDNAVRYTRRGAIVINLQRDDDELICTISDTGTGIAKKYLDNIFKLPAASGSDYRRVIKGLGLGLALTKRYLDLNKIGVEVTSIHNQGTRFKLVFRLAAEKTRPVTTLLSRDKSTLKNRMIKRKPLVLVVEDDANSQRLIHYFLKNDYGVSFAISTAKAREQLEKNQIDLVLLDLSLKGDEDGIALVKFMRNSSNYQSIPVVACTAHTSVVDRDNCLEAGCNDFLAKPIKKSELIEKIHQYFI